MCQKLQIYSTDGASTVISLLFNYCRGAAARRRCLHCFCRSSTCVPLLWRGANTSLGWRLSTLMLRTPLLANVAVVASGKDERQPAL